jgi:hypothetical protein
MSGTNKDHFNRAIWLFVIGIEENIFMETENIGNLIPKQGGGFR